ncbi:hypothetical protein Apa02nite_010330 [Actinoplanes palleronii]|uniref:Uncharacterized protein n=1 Tax=Actinoplanes palleronii TaxID=113570 RepID=A0ABQ4B2N1_9ACTN|nr:hypothetical protein Apa02nite_010330 [Actinoplanes palleronii]
MPPSVSPTVGELLEIVGAVETTAWKAPVAEKAAAGSARVTATLPATTTAVAANAVVALRAREVFAITKDSSGPPGHACGKLREQNG